MHVYRMLSLNVKNFSCMSYIDRAMDSSKAKRVRDYLLQDTIREALQENFKRALFLEAVKAVEKVEV